MSPTARDRRLWTVWDDRRRERRATAHLRPNCEEETDIHEIEMLRVQAPLGRDDRARHPTATEPRRRSLTHKQTPKEIGPSSSG